ncbi:MULTISPECIES: LysR family transcriptional regulator [Actinomyces]|uniref:LysR family transcriptional regulator n=1 Tax=Actinomyces respiraculi TaxID=2744574 RepID=A0A7T0LM58_9ACTO|nr:MULTISPECIES: LysR family transcriptional regulator [Actinomyces]QPL06132.1 LysR family transcriptional regulator [Actinomyces respiraculi]
MDLSAHRLALLLAVHRAGGIVAAAQAQHLTPSAVSQQIKLLEKEAGTRLLDRTPRGAVLTDAGRLLSESAERIELELVAARRSLAEMDPDAPSGHVHVGTIATVIRALLVPLLVRAEQDLPGLTITVEETEGASALTRLRNGELDLLLLERDATAPVRPARGTADVPVLDESWLVVSPPGQAAPGALGDLVRPAWIDLAPGTAGADALERLSRQLGTSLSRRHIAYDYDVVLAMVSAGLGWALLPELAVLSATLPDGVSATRLPGLGTRQLIARHRASRRDPSPAVRALVDLVHAEAAALELG